MLKVQTFTYLAEQLNNFSSCGFRGDDGGGLCFGRLLLVDWLGFYFGMF